MMTLNSKWVRKLGLKPIDGMKFKMDEEFRLKNIDDVNLGTTHSSWNFIFTNTGGF
jgi:hypothetical protein